MPLFLDAQLDAQGCGAEAGQTQADLIDGLAARLHGADQEQPGGRKIAEVAQRAVVDHVGDHDGVIGPLALSAAPLGVSLGYITLQHRTDFMAIRQTLLYASQVKLRNGLMSFAQLSWC